MARRQALIVLAIRSRSLAWRRRREGAGIRAFPTVPGVFTRVHGAPRAGWLYADEHSGSSALFILSARTGGAARVLARLCESF